jgi:hypothetical protein
MRIWWTFTPYLVNKAQKRSSARLQKMLIPKFTIFFELISLPILIPFTQDQKNLKKKIVDRGEMELYLRINLKRFKFIRFNLYI